MGKRNSQKTKVSDRTQHSNNPESKRLCNPSGIPVVRLARQVRHNQGLSQDQMAFMTGINPATISRWERGFLRLQWHQAAAVQLALGMSFEQLDRPDTDANEKCSTVKRRTTHSARPELLDSARPRTLGNCLKQNQCNRMEESQEEG
ncbi:MAG: helix-turn-helix transcriptional regulator [bacterium]|nr:helix-turn-helix transcriptional regulator [bacterium]